MGSKNRFFSHLNFSAGAVEELPYRDENLIVTRKGDRHVVIGWNAHDMRDRQPSPDRSCAPSLPATGDQVVLIRKGVGRTHANPLQTWSNLGKSRTFAGEQAAILRQSAEPLQTDIGLSAHAGMYEVDATIPCNHLLMHEIIPVRDKTDTYPGFDPEEFYGVH